MSVRNGRASLGEPETNDPGAGPSARTYAGRSPQVRRDERRERLMDAALVLFGTEGYSRTTIPGLCRAANVTTRHFYEEFEGREALLRAVYDRVIADTAVAVQASLEAAADDPYERLRAGLGAFLGAYLDDPRRGRIACVEVVGISAELERHRRSVIHQFAAVIARESERNIRQGRLPDRDVSLGAIAMAGATNELVIEWLTRESPPPIARLTDELIRLFLAVLEGAQAAHERITGRGASVDPAPSPPRSTPKA